MPLDAALIAAMCDGERTRELFAERYRLVEGIGAGDFAFTYKATDEVSGEAVVVRVARRSRASAPGVTETFVKAARRADGVEHSALPRVLADGVTEDGCPFIVRAYVEGEAVMGMRQRGALGGRELVEVLVALAEPLVAMHENGLVHGALEGRRALVRKRDGRASVVLLGIGRRALEQATGSGPVGRTCIAPEVKAGAPETVRSDIYGFSAMCAELVIGQPFGDGWKRAVGGLGIVGLREVLEVGLATDPADRWASVAELAAALRFSFVDPMVSSRAGDVHDLETMQRALGHASPKLPSGETPRPVAFSVETQASPQGGNQTPAGDNAHAPSGGTMRSAQVGDDANRPQGLAIVGPRAAARPDVTLASPGAPPPVKPVSSGRIGRFVTGRLLGRGGMGEVYEAVDPVLDRRVALKLIRKEEHGAGPDGEAVSRLLREARAAAVITHANIVTIHEAGEVDGIAYIAMELVDGETLRAKLKSGPLPPAEVVRIVIEIVRGLERAHEAGIVHRDLKPENVMVTKDGGIKILDFGIARRGSGGAYVPGANLGTFTEAGAFVGTPQYMSPEQALGGPLDWRSDQFALGVVTYELLSGRSPWAYTTGSELVAAILAANVPSWHEIPHGLAPILQRILSKNVAARYETWAAVLTALREVDGLSLHQSSAHAADVAVSRARGRRSIPRWIGTTAVIAASVASIALSPPRRTLPALAQAPQANPSSTVADHAPKTESPRAAAYYREGVALMRGASLGAGIKKLGDAVEADPALAAARLRIVLFSLYPDAPLRAQYTSIEPFKDALSPAERAAYDSLKPWAATNSDPRATLTLLSEVAASLKDEADIAAAIAYRTAHLRNHDEAIRLSRQILSRDPSYTLARFIEGSSLAEVFRIDEAASTFRLCAAESPTAEDCTRLLAIAMSHQGKCQEPYDIAQDMISRNPDSTRAYAMLAVGTYGLNHSVPATRSALQQQWERDTSPVGTYRKRRAEVSSRSYLATCREPFASSRIGREPQRACRANSTLWASGRFDWTWRRNRVAPPNSRLGPRSFYQSGALGRRLVISTARSFRSVYFT